MTTVENANANPDFNSFPCANCGDPIANSYVAKFIYDEGFAQKPRQSAGFLCSLTFCPKSRSDS